MTPQETAAIAATAAATSQTEEEAAATAISDENKPATLEETVNAIVEEHRADDVPSDDAEAETSSTSESDQENKTLGEEEQPQEGVEEEPAPKQLSKVEQEKLEATFQQSARFKEMHEAVEKTKPLAEQRRYDLDFMQKHGVSEDDWNQSRVLLALSKTNPDEFWAKMDQLKESYDVLKGKRLPSDIQKMVDDQAISIEVAKDLARLRVEKQQLSQTVAQSQAQQQQSFANAVAQTANEWDAQKARADADFSPKKNATDPDGKYEMVNAVALQMLSASPPRDLAGVRALLDAAYARVDATFKRFQPRPRPSRPKLPNGSSSTTSNGAEPTNLMDFVQNSIGKKHGIRLQH